MQSDCITIGVVPCTIFDMALFLFSSISSYFMTLTKSELTKRMLITLSSVPSMNNY